MRIIKCSIPPVEGNEPRYLIGLVEDITERREIEERMAHIAMHDSLTGLPNRAYFAHHVESLLKKGGDSEPFALFYLDIDHFKNINDTYGHSSGDAVLQQVAEAILSLCRPSDFVFRYGGEEFLVALVEADENKAFTIAEELRRQIAQQPLNLPDGARQSVTLSIGVAAFNGHPDYSHLVNAADRALYRAKQAGRNRCEKEVPLAIH